jgi:crotonobetainyl-CoA:carnitine CoA-transferase CaiB-like acyl-CoA transferase
VRVQNILSGIRVVDAATYIAGPCAATVLADYGADVIKVERPGGDAYRKLSSAPGQPQADDNYCWMVDNRNRRGIALDLTKPAARTVLHRLSDRADVFITNFQPYLLTRFELDAARLRARNPRLIYASVSGYGEAGEEAGKAAYDTTAYWARSGLMHTLFNAGAEPCKNPPGMGDHPAGLALVSAILLAILNRERTGQGMTVSTSLLAAGIWTNACFVQAGLCEAEWPERRGRTNALNALTNHYTARDGERFILGLLDMDKDWPKLCAALGDDGLRADARFATPEARAENATELIACFDAAFAARDLAEWRARFAACDVLWGPVLSSAQVAADPQALANGILPEIEGTAQRTVSTPMRLEGVEKVAPRPAPAPGEHTGEVLRELGYDEAEVRRLLESGAVSAG